VPLTDGRPNRYAFGLEIATYRGQRLVQHTGSTGGYRAAIYRFPDEHTTMAMLCNVSTANTNTLALAMADAVLGARLGARESVTRGAGGRGGAAPPSHPAAGALLSAVSGRYRSDELLDAVWLVAAGADGTLSVRRPRAVPESLRWVSDYTFSDRSVTLSFDQPVNGVSPGFTVKGDRVLGLRFDRAVATPGR
jgi:hypothetical protein